MTIKKYCGVMLVAFLCFSFNTLAQTEGQLKGKLRDANNVEVVYASLSLFQKDSVFVKSAISTTTGDFNIIALTPGIYRLQVDHIEFETFVTPDFTISENETKTLSDIVLRPASNSLDEVVINHKKAQIEVKADKLVFNVASSPSASGTNGLDLLKKSPGVTVDLDNSISLLGKKNVQIYLNGVPSRLSGDDLTTFLQSMTSDVIDSIEIISNPSAKYDAEGTGGIINIRMKRNMATGFNGSATSSFTKGVEYKYSNNLSLNYGSGKINTNFDITQSEDDNLEIFLDQKQQNNSILFLDSREVQSRKGYNIGFGLDANLSDKHYLSLSGRSILNNNDNNLNSTTDIYQASPLEFSETLSSQSYLDGQSSNYIVNLNHIWSMSDTASLNTNFSLGLYDTDKSTLQPNTYFDADGVIIDTDNTTFDANTNINLWSAKVDYEKEWEQITFSIGAKYTRIATENGFKFYTIEDDETIFDPTKSNDFNYTENVAAAYANLSLKLSNVLTINAGLRVENTDSRGKLISDTDIDNKDVPRNYTDYFPNIGILFDNQNDHSLSLSLGRRITRPNYQDLNPFETPTSQLVIWKGNPFLKPNYIMNYQASYAYRQKLIITASYSKTKDFFAKIIEITGEDETQIIPRNMEKSINYGISVSYPLKINSFWDVIGFANVSQQSFQGDLEGTIIDLETTLWDYRIQNELNITKGFLVDITFTQRGDWIWRGTVDIEGTHGLSFGIRKDFLNKKLQIRATGSDIFRTETDYPYNSNYGGIQLHGTYTNDNQRFGLGATYKFGDQQSKTKKKTKSALDDELDRITN
jgi:outer membrane receptor protein involved in Fe transport